MVIRLFLILLMIGLYGFSVLRRSRKGARMSIAVWIGVLIVSVYAGLGLALYVFQPRFVFQPWKGLEVGPGAVGPDVEEAVITTPDGVKLHGWYVPAEGARRTVLFCHGNAGNLGHRADTLAFFRRLGLNCLIFDYRGYGNSEGRPTEAGVYADARAAWDWLAKAKGVTASQVILFGRSLGGAVAARLASDLQADGMQPAGLVLESTFSNFVDMGRHYYPYMPIRLFARFDFDTAGAAAGVRCPVLVIHSPDDEIVPFELGQKVFEAAKEPRRFAEISGGHNEGFAEDWEQYRGIWEDWLGGLLDQGPGKEGQLP